MSRRALLVGIDNYQIIKNLQGCVNDVEAMNAKLSWHQDGSPNFSTKKIVNEEATTQRLHSEIEDLFSKQAESVIFYFSGHGVFDPIADFGFIVTTDGKQHAYGVALDTILRFANSANPHIKNTIIILDCCYSGEIGNLGLKSGSTAASIGKGVTLITASNSNEVAKEINAQGLFTSIIINGLSGEAADIEGNITPAMLYAHVDQSLGAFEQRPLYKANVQAFSVLRKVNAKATHEELRQLPSLFSAPNVEILDDLEVYRLGPWCEPSKDRGEYQEKYRGIEFDDKSHKRYRLLQKFEKAGLIEPHNQPHMWHAAMEETGCYLTRLGKHYKNLAEKGRFGKVTTNK